MSDVAIRVLISLAMGLAFLLVSLFKPAAGRICLGVFFVVTGIANLLIGLLSPAVVVQITNNALLPFYKDITTRIVAPVAALFLFLLALYELAAGLLVLSKGSSVKLGLLGMMIFCLSIVPVGPETMANLLLVAAQAFLLTKTFDRSLLEMMRRRFQHRIAV